MGEYYEARQEVEKEVTQLKKFFGSQKEMPGKTKADIAPWPKGSRPFCH